MQGLKLHFSEVQRSLSTDLADTSVASVEHRLLHSQQLLEQVPIPHSVYGRDDHLKERSFLAVLEAWYHLLPQVHATQLKVHVVAPQVTCVWQLDHTVNTPCLDWIHTPTTATINASDDSIREGTNENFAIYTFSHLSQDDLQNWSNVRAVSKFSKLQGSETVRQH